MSLGLWEWVLYLVLLTEGIVLIVAALLQRAGIKSFRTPRGFRRLPVGTTILFGAGLALGSITNVIPANESTHVLRLCLYPVAICLMIASAVAWLREKPV
jgi:heme A synthase